MFGLLFAYSDYRNYWVNTIDPSCKHLSFKLTENRESRTQTVIMLMIFWTLRVDLLTASRAIVVRRSVIPKMLLWNVCLTGKHKEVKNTRKTNLLYPFFFFSFFFFACSIDLSSNKPSISSISNVKGSLFHTCDHSLQKLSTNCRHCLVASFEVLFSLMSPCFVIKIDTGFMRADVFWSIQKRHYHSVFLLLLF